LLPASVRADNNRPAETVPVGQIRANRYQPRRHFLDSALKELSDSIRDQGLIQPLVVAEITPPDGDIRYELIAGERRWRASKLAGLAEVPVVIKKATDKELLQLSLIENLQREDLNPIEEAFAFKRLMEEFSLTQEEVARIVGKGRVVVANTLRLLHLPEQIQNAVADGTISAGHARNLVSINDPQMQKEVAERILQEKITVREVEKIVADWKGAIAEGRVRIIRKKDPEIRQLEDELQKTLSTKVEIRSRGTVPDLKGTVTVSFYSMEDLERLSRRLKQNI
jgi:ParB family chromosome partitioning protein